MDENVGGEAQVCRLCGQFESIYIDVFGDEGTRRLLGLKIHSRINILIKEDDQLPKIVCIRCVGTLEFLCDFVDQCQETQEKLKEKDDANTPAPPPDTNDFNKENIRSSRHKSLSPPSSRKPRAPADFPSQDLENVTPSSGASPDISENILSEILHTRNKRAHSRKQYPKIRNITSLREALKTTGPTTLKRPSAKSVSNPEEKIKKIESVIDRTISGVTPRSRTPKIRFSLQKFIHDPEESSSVLEPPETIKIPRKLEKSDTKLDSPPDPSPREAVEEVSEQPIEQPLKESAMSPPLGALTAQESNGPSEISKSSPGAEEKFSEVGPEDQKFHESTRKSQKSTELLIAEDEGLSKNSPQFNDSKTKKSKTASPRVSRSPSEPHLQSDASDPPSRTRTPPEDILKKNTRSLSSPPPSSGQKTRNSQSSNASESLKPRRRRRSSSESSSCSSVPTSTSSTSKRRKSGAIYGTVSQLISSEEKETIEKFYTIDMSVVDESVVEKNLTYLDKKRTMCLICSALYPRIDKCKVHIWGHLEMKPYKCTACDFSTLTVTNIRCHIRKSHLKIKPFECNFCKKRYVTAILLEEHLNTHSGLRPFKCTVCPFSSASRQVLSYHMTTHKPVKDVTCDICGKEFFSRGRMRAHMITHNKNRELMCKFCSHHFSSAEALQKHLDNLHSSDYVCDICGKSTKSRKALHNHQNVHSEAKFKCNLCPNVYKSGHILKEHLLKHEGIRKYKCEVCDKAFAQQSHLAAHMAVHSEKRFKCPGCQRAFNRHDNMKIHTKRCSMFKANPQLQDMLHMRVKGPKVARLDEAEGMSHVIGKGEEITHTIGNGEGIIQTNGSDEGREEVHEVDQVDQVIRKGTFSIGQVVVIPFTGGTVEECRVKEAVAVTENVIGLECF
uniref:ZNF226_1 protein n=2 Tax=Fopius arisanus TaxID=64838 RepID=A0A0C9QT68_9HYME